MAQPTWSRVLLKLSGEAFAGGQPYGIDGPTVEQIASEIVEARTQVGVDVAVVVGGGNIWRGMTGASAGMDRAQADYMGMLATVINALALQDTLEQLDQATRVQSAIHMAQVAEPYIRRRAIRHLVPVLEPLGHRRCQSLRLPHRLDQADRPAGRISGPAARCGAEQSRGSCAAG